MYSTYISDISSFQFEAKKESENTEEIQEQVADKYSAREGGILICQ